MNSKGSDGTLPAAKPRPATEPGGPEFVERYVNNGLEYQYYQAIRAQASCLTLCHKTYPAPGGFDVPIGGKLLAGEPLQEGDLMAVVQVTIPSGPTQAAVTETLELAVCHFDCHSLPGFGSFLPGDSLCDHPSPATPTGCQRSHQPRQYPIAGRNPHR